jgi:hypothetical protein
VAGLFVSLGFFIAVMTLYFRWVDDWLQKKESKIGDVRNAKTSALMSALDSTCRINAKFHATSDEENFTVRDFTAIIESAKAVEKSVDEFMEWNGLISNMSVRMRKASIPWLICVIFANLANISISWEEYFGTALVINGSNITLPSFLIFMAIAVICAAIALLPLKRMIENLNKLDLESLGFQTIRSWEKRT